MNISKGTLIFKCFGFFIGIQYIYYKIIAFFLKNILKFSGNKSNFLVKLIKKYIDRSDKIVKNYIFSKYRTIYDKYQETSIEGSVPKEKYIWTCWLQGTDDLPYAVSKSFESMNKNSGEYNVIVLTLENLYQYVDIDSDIIEKYLNGNILAAHLTDYIRMKILSVYGGVWLDATQYVTRTIPDMVWDYPLLVWNKIYDLTDKNAYIAIPFVEKFNNGFLVAKMDAQFYQFATEITGALLSDDILKIDYFGNFKAYFVGVEKIEYFNQLWYQMDPINPYGLLTRQYWNKPISSTLKNYIDDKCSFFFTLTYKKDWITDIDEVQTVQEYIIKEY